MMGVFIISHYLFDKWESGEEQNNSYKTWVISLVVFAPWHVIPQKLRTGSENGILGGT